MTKRWHGAYRKSFVGKVSLLAGIAVALLGGAKSAFAQGQPAVLPRAGWVATASTSSSSDTPANAIDGSGSTRFSTGADQTGGQWFSVDMITPQTFSEITIDPTGSSNDWTQGYQVFVSNDAVNWGAPIASGTGTAGVLTVVFPTQTARFIGIVQTNSGSYWWSIGEFNVYGPGAIPTAILSPTGWVATASNTGGSDVPSRAIDGSLSTRWTTGTSQANGQWFRLDMLQEQTVAGITMNSDGSGSDYARGYQVFVSNDPSNFGTAVATGTGTSSLINVTFQQKPGRYLKIIQTGTASNYWSLAELSVIGIGSFAPTAQVLPRTGWITSASVSCSSDTPPKAIDDSLSTRYSTCQNQTVGQSFQVDMLTATSFTKLTLDAGSGNDYPRGYAVYVSQDGTSWGTSIATGSGTGQLVTINFPYQNARFVKVVLTSSITTNWWSIAEFNVYGIPPYLLLRDAWVASASLNSSAAHSGIDGNLSTRWTTNTSQASGQWYQLDMLAPQSFKQLILSADGATSDYPRGYQVLTSNDGTTWSNPIATGTGSSSLVSIGFPTQFARYIRVIQTGSASNWWSIAEINVFGLCGGTSPCVPTNTVVLKCAQGTAMDSCVETLVNSAASATASQHDDVTADLQKWRAVPGFSTAMANNAMASFNPAGTLGRTLVKLAMLGELRSPEGTDALKTIAHMPLPTSGACTGDDCESGERAYVAAAQLKAIQGLAFLNTAAGDAEVFSAISSTSNDSLQVAAVSAYLWNHGATASNRAMLAAMLPANRQFLVDRFIKDATTPTPVLGQALITFYNQHPDMQPAVP